jgi:hypothetical protein
MGCHVGDRRRGGRGGLLEPGPTERGRRFNARSTRARPGGRVDVHWEWGNDLDKPTPGLVSIAPEASLQGSSAAPSTPQNVIRIADYASRRRDAA